MSTIRLPCPFGGEDRCPNRLWVSVSARVRGTALSPPEEPTVDDVTGCPHVEGDYDLVVLEAALDEWAREREERG